MSVEFPFTGGGSVLAEQELPPFREYAWDFENDCFIYDDAGKRIIVEGDEALKIWVYKALKTERYEYLAYSWQYGIELKPFIGKVMGVYERYSELKRVIIECLMVNPYIRSVDSVDFQTDGDYTHCDIALTTVYGEVNINV
ncbi:DUF2634 domain-containing protein [uncultured Veillonella sp.]|uniref:DUF2634 domain-containing protein n=1 Tax=uncultured Veillonella sp. TaxID=159268 RepID=UPI002805EB64|nr:DUF2634 domain-containing protein [uncultured Veillonella sp.]